MRPLDYSTTIRSGISDEKPYLNITIRYQTPIPKKPIDAILSNQPKNFPQLSAKEQARLTTLKGQDLEQALKKGEVILMQARAHLGITQGLEGKAYLGRNLTTPKQALKEIYKTASYIFPNLQKDLTTHLTTPSLNPKKAKLIQELIDYLDQLT